MRADDHGTLDRAGRAPRPGVRDDRDQPGLHLPRPERCAPQDRLDRPDATAAAFEGRWLKTGDAARIDDEGFVYIVDRWKDMYISGGENVYPAEVENVLYQLPAVAEAAVIGIPSDRWGETGLAVIALKEGESLDRQEVQEYCAERLAKFKVPADIAIVDELPRNATGKVLKRELRDQFVSEHAPRIS